MFFTPLADYRQLGWVDVSKPIIGVLSLMGFLTSAHPTMLESLRLIF